MRKQAALCKGVTLKETEEEWEKRTVPISQSTYRVNAKLVIPLVCVTGSEERRCLGTSSPHACHNAWRVLLSIQHSRFRFY